ncbi:MarR family winged helix-turn-helix transcriptional regulator [Streptomyces sp. NPDC002574]|uniref:MarR family winged helix-turn-helix transcriptional regulator n=1 Tax=Streptomyces sp. NPDC002574 TaxID=3364652 RepID=UPI003698F843
MPAREAAPSRICCEASQSVSSITELLDVMWERSRGATAPASTSQLRLMYVVDRQDGIRMRAVCDLLASSPPNVSRMCDRLQAVGFLERLPHPESGREITLRLSPAGKKYLQGIRDQREAMLYQAIHRMPASELRALARGLTGLAAQLTAADNEEDSRPGAHVPAQFLRRGLEPVSDMATAPSMLAH